SSTRLTPRRTPPRATPGISAAIRPRRSISERSAVRGGWSAGRTVLCRFLPPGGSPPEPGQPGEGPAENAPQGQPRATPPGLARPRLGWRDDRYRKHGPTRQRRRGIDGLAWLVG